MVRARSGGFTLVEVVIAVGIVTTGVLAVIGLVGIGIQSASGIRDQDAALRLRSSVEAAFHHTGQYEAIYRAVRSDDPIYVHCYGVADGEPNNGDGTLTASPTSDFILAESHANTTRTSGDPNLDAGWGASQVVFRAEVSVFDPVTGERIDPSDSAKMPEDPFELDPARIGAVVTLYKLPPASEEPVDVPEGKRITTFTTVLRP